ncbi:hypothetical protein EDC30_109137 [Paucimonas lemoignei]|uniref:Uncharacterized protein n=1 Tax=Paucimonas lemoignei TaxID=29443 RepID=A0A4R3HSC2_PAULE|nr:hypothetical protein [Paucimonas lemoignei]TCS35838.1 hypothetical protein EDC30_109137 [Paucimonas lemoignei]
MSKWFEVKVTKVTVYAVEVEDDEDADKAQEYALNEADGFDEVEVSPEIVGAENIDRIRRHADETLEI